MRFGEGPLFNSKSLLRLLTPALLIGTSLRLTLSFAPNLFYFKPCNAFLEGQGTTSLPPTTNTEGAQQHHHSGSCSSSTGAASSSIAAALSPASSSYHHIEPSAANRRGFYTDMDTARFAVHVETDGMGEQELASNMQEWIIHREHVRKKRYQIIAAPVCEDMAKNLESKYPERFRFHPTKWGKFPDGTDNIEVGGFQPHNVIAGEHILFLASFHNNDVTLSQFQVMVMLLQSFVQSLTIVLPFYPVGTMERVVKEGQVATANTYAQMFSNLPSAGRPTRLIVYDLHTLQNRFYLHGSTIASLQTTIPILLEALSKSNINCVAFPDDGAAKRFAHMFKPLDLEIVICGKVRDGDKRSITVQDGDAMGKHVIIVDDLVQTGGTLYECGVALKSLGALSVSAFVAHSVFPNTSWKRFARGGDRGVFERFYTTNSIPTVTSTLPDDDVFVVLDLTDKVVYDLDYY